MITGSKSMLLIKLRCKKIIKWLITDYIQLHEKM